MISRYFEIGGDTGTPVSRQEEFCKVYAYKTMAVSDTSKDTAKLPTLDRCMDGMVAFVL